MKRTIWMPLLISSTWFIFSCSSCVRKPSVVASVTCDIAFQIDNVGGWKGHPPLINGDTLYLFNSGDSPNTVLAIDLHGYSTLWKTSPTSGLFEEAPHPFLCTEIYFLNGSLWVDYFSGIDDYLVEMNPGNGECLKMIRIMNAGSRDKVLCDSLAGYGTSLFYVNETGIACFDTTALTLVDADTKLYEATATQAYTFAAEKTNGYLLRAKGNALICSYRQRDNYADTGLICVEMDTLSTRWVTPKNSCYWEFRILGDAVYSPVLSYDDGTEESWAYRFRGFSLADGSTIGSFDSNTDAECPPIQYKDTVIQTSTQNNPGDGLNGKPMLYCLYADSLNVKWRVDFTDELCWSGTNCGVWNGILYQPFGEGVRLFDVESGELLGLDEGIHASDSSSSTDSLQYHDLLIVNDGWDDRLLGIRMNFRETGSGLVKE